jgi:REG-2-like HAD superfamily hydrolase
VIQIVFFDAGETLLCPYPSFPELFASTCRANGCEVTASEVAAAQKKMGPHHIEAAYEAGIENPTLSLDASRRFWTAFYKRLLAELRLPETLTEHVVATFSDRSSYRLFDDAAPAIEAIRADGYRVGLISNFESWLDELLVELELGESFDVVAISALEGVEKPDPRLYETALERAGVAPSEAVHVGDSVKFDVEPAERLGMHPILIDRIGRYEGRGRWPTISSLKDLRAEVANISR